MTENITNKRPQIWKPGQSGNPKGRPPRNRALTEILRLQGQEAIEVNGAMISAQEIVAKAIWHLAAHGEVWLSGRRLEAESVSEWVNVIKWLYTYIEPPRSEAITETEMVVRVVREDSPPVNDMPYAGGVDVEPEADSLYALPPVIVLSGGDGLQDSADSGITDALPTDLPLRDLPPADLSPTNPYKRGRKCVAINEPVENRPAWQQGNRDRVRLACKAAYSQHRLSLIQSILQGEGE